jgi:hypothetical protein
MRCEHYFEKHQRGSSPLQKPKLVLSDWMKSCRSIDQHPYDVWEIQSFRDLTALEKKTNQESGLMKGAIKTSGFQNDQCDKETDAR